MSELSAVMFKEQLDLERTWKRSDPVFRPLRSQCDLSLERLSFFFLSNLVPKHGEKAIFMETTWARPLTSDLCRRTR